MYSRASVHTQTYTQTLLRRLRRQLTATFVLVASLAFVVLGVLLLRLDTEFEARHLTTELRGQASRATALVYVEDGKTMVDGVQDDTVTTWAYGLAVVEVAKDGRLTPLFTSGRADPNVMQGLARGALSDVDERGTVGDLTIQGELVHAVAMPWFDGDAIRGAAITVAPPPQMAASRMLLPAVLGGVGLIGTLTVTVWLLAGRSLRPAGEALADRERFLASSAHELRAPLARLRAGAEAARRTTPAHDPASQALRRLVTVADSAGRVVSNILLASRIDHAEVPIGQAPVRLDQVAAEIEHMQEEVVVDIQEPVVVVGDAGLLRHAIVNLVDNALRHGRVGEDAPTVVVRVFHRRGVPVVRVSDDGPGFPPGLDVLARYVSGARGGTGLGLPLVQWISERHKATMTLSGGTEEDPGAVVELSFPACRVARATPTQLGSRFAVGRPGTAEPPADGRGDAAGSGTDLAGPADERDCCPVG